ncbi:hypothetical protein T069G_09156 [Trichoderma breve]|uniref:Caspase domain-containing protein n=1 Tax=Trichoderma breve TaxID=2034170 RepID=A0A9W9B456_9HYPO|nr:hypothetical protein T069G_09156 [Trichoderma breve]KAJ4855788.1 hypothetical protein T069G_09156 [Trichoderma breve]
MKEYLESGLDPVDITMLTASASLDSSSQLPSEAQDSWPTRSNSEDLALVLFENNEHGTSYFKGDILASCFKKMADRGLIVTVVLDCCFSGSILRTGNVRGVGIRSVKYNPTVEAATSPEHQDDFGSHDGDYPLRSYTLLNQWLVDPKDYTILSACGPHEIAHELELSTGERRGALSYFLVEALSALRKRGVDINHESIYEYMRIRFHASWPRQTPMRYGNKNFSFFGGPAIASSRPFAYVYTKNNSLCLDAGEAHGVHTGDIYKLHPPEWLGDSANQVGDTSVTARVDTVRCLTSDLTNVEPETTKKEIGTGWHAKLLTSLSQRKISVRLPANVYDRVHQAKTLEDQSYLHLCISDDDGEACMFNVVFNDQGHYEILDGLGGTIANLPSIPAGAQGAEQRLMDTLQHLSKFKYAEGIENRTPDTSFEMLFSLVSYVCDEEPSISSVFDVEHGGTWQLEIENKGKTALYFTLFNFTPSWKIKNLLSELGHNGFWVLEPNSKAVLPLVMKVPELLQIKGTRCCEDIIKVFITSKATSFPSMILPEIPLYRSHYRGQHDEARDGLLALNTGLTGSPSGHNTGYERWATQNFIIKTRMT